MDWVPVVLFTFKFLVFATGMFFAIKWHYDKGKEERRAARRAGVKVAAILLPLFLGLGLAAYVLVRTSGLDLGLP